MNIPPSFTIRGLGTAQPEHEMLQAEAADLAAEVAGLNEEDARVVRVLYRRAGVASRRIALPHRTALQWVAPADEAGVQVAVTGPTTAERMHWYREYAPPLAVQAARRALDDAAWAPDQIDYLITVSCTGFAAPGVDQALLGGLGLRPTVERVNVGFMGCHGAINALRVARGLAAAAPHAGILLCAVELCSLHYRFQFDPLTAVGNAVFADCAAAIVGSAVQPAIGGAAHQEQPWRVVDTGSCLLAASSDAMSWQLGDHGFEMSLSPQVPDHILAHLRPWMTQWLAKHSLTLSDVGSWAIHPGGPRILHAAEQALGLAGDDTAVSRTVLRNCGNMSSPTVLFVLDQLRALDAPRPCVALAFGPGLTAETALIL